MLFKDQAQQLVSKWECLRSERELETLAVQTAVAISPIREVPTDVLDALDKLLDCEYKERATSISRVLRFLHSLTEDRTIAARRL